jgi:DivIVA domain-containing protein
VPLTPTDVANKQFRIAFRGYSLDEVDAFLDEVETELTRLLRDNAALKDRPAAAAAPVAAPVATTAAPAETAAAPVPAAPLASMEGQEAALRTLLLAQRTADEAIAEARAEAEQIVAAARAEAESTLGSARAEAEATLKSSQEKAGRIDQDVAARIQAATGDLDARRRDLEKRIEELRAFEREYRTRLKAYLEAQLRDLDTGATPDDGGSGVPAGARAAAVAGAAGSASRGPAGPGGGAPQPVAGPGGPGVVAADGPPQEAEGASSLRAVPPLATGAAPVGPFQAVPAGGADGADGPDKR